VIHLVCRRALVPFVLTLLACGRSTAGGKELKEVELRDAPRCGPGKRPEAGLVFRVVTGDAFVQGAFPPEPKPRGTLHAGRARLRLGRCPAETPDCADPRWISDDDVEILEHQGYYGVDAHTLPVRCVVDPAAPPPPPPPLRALAFSPDGARLAALDEQHLFLRRADLGTIADVPFAGGVAVVFSPDGTHVAVAAPSGVAVFDGAGAPAGKLEAPSVRLLAWADAGLVTAGKEVVSWDVAAGKSRTTRAAFATALAPDGSTYATSELPHGPTERPRKDGGREWVIPETKVTVFDLASGAERFTASRVNLRPILLVRGDFILHGTSDVEVYRGGNKVAGLATAITSLPDLGTPDGARWCWIDGNYKLFVADPASGRMLFEEWLNAHPTAMAISPDGHRVAVATVEQGLKVWDLP
jgi:hypothetical protein